MDKQEIKLAIGGEFFVKQYRDGNRIDAKGNIIGEDDVESSGNIFIDQGLIYALNAAFAVSVGGAPSPITNFYIGLSTANRAWQAGDLAATIHTVSTEFETYDEATRQAWVPQALATSGTITLDDSGAEATFTIGAVGAPGQIIYGAMLISASAKDGTGDAVATLAAGSNFTTERTLFEDDIFKVGYVLSAENKV